MTNLVNVDKIKEISKSKGISVAFICARLGHNRGYLNDVKRANTPLSAEEIRIIADTLHTNVEYLIDQSDDPAPPGIRPESDDELLLMKIAQLNEDQRKEVERKIDRLILESLKKK